jgi:hypothetical protein
VNVRLVRLRSAMALYQMEHKRWPSRLPDLQGPYIPALPLDPWSTPQEALRFSAAESRLYSVGLNRRDDLGSFKKTMGRD